MKRTLLIFASLIAAILILFQLGQYSFIKGDLKIETLISIIAIVFFLVGAYINRQYRVKRVSISEPGEIDHKRIAELNISKREYEVLKWMAEGLSNKEIGEKLFVSESTVKTHVSSLLQKLNSRRRTQAIQRAKQEKIL